MRRLKLQNGITLIALVVTIIVLLILAGISISMLTGQNGILNRAGEAKEDTRGGDIQERIALIAAENTSAQFLGGTKQTREEVIAKLHNEGKLTDSEVEILADYDTITIGGITVDFSALGKIEWEYDHESQTVKKGTQKLNIGDYIEDKGTQTVEGFDGKWRVLGAEDGQLLLISATYYAPFEEDRGNGITRVQVGPPGAWSLKLQGKDGWDNAVERLNKISAKYNNSKLEKARSVTVEDINTVTGYNPNESRIDSSDLTKKGPYGSGYSSQYQNNVTYTIKNGKVWYKGDKAETDERESNFTRFWLLGTSSNITEPFTIQCTRYNYYPETLGEFSASSVAAGQTLPGIANTSAAYDMLFRTPYGSYWLASPCVSSGEGCVFWSVYVATGKVVSAYYLWYSDQGSNCSWNGVRPVVSLKSNIKPTFKSKDATTEISTYEI